MPENASRHRTSRGAIPGHRRELPSDRAQGFSKKSRTTYRLCESWQRNCKQQRAAVALSQGYLTLANDRYETGVDSYLNVITAQTGLLSNQQTAMTPLGCSS